MRVNRPKVYRVSYTGLLSKEKIAIEFKSASEAIALCRRLAASNIEYRFTDWT